MMSKSFFQCVRWFRNKLLMLGLLVLLTVVRSLCAFAQDSESRSAFPSPPSAKVPSENARTVVKFDHSVSFADRADLYAHSLFNFEVVLGPAFGAGIGQWENEPAGWHQGGEGYGKRFGSGVARREIAETIRFGFAAADREDPRYFVSENRGIWARTQHAIISTVVSHTSSGQTIPAFSRLAGVYGAAFISNTWYPDNRATASYAAERGSTSLGATVAFNLLREFVPLFRGRSQ